MTRIVPIDPAEPDPAIVREAVAICRAGGSVVYPTDTIYGLGTDAANADAVGRLFEIKGRPPVRSMPVLIGDPGQLFAVAGHLVGKALRLTELFWPGPLTLVVPGHATYAHLASPGGAVGVRLPACEVARRIAIGLGGPIVGTSANKSGEQPPRDPRAIADALPGVDLLLDAGPIPESLGSTVVDTTRRRFRVLRRGDVSVEALRGAVPDAEFEWIGG